MSLHFIEQVIQYVWKPSVVDLDPTGSLDPFPDPDSQSGSGSRRGKMTHKNGKKVKKFHFKCWMFSFEG
jgi:hypothetical protein